MMKKKSCFFALFIVTAFLLACGDDSSGTDAQKEGSTGNENVQEQPWASADSVVSGVCNIHACDKSSEGERIYVKANGKIYQCKSGTWLDSKGKEFSEQEFIGCYIKALVRDSVEARDSLKTCTSKMEGDLYVVSSDLVACASQKWVSLSYGVVSEDNLPDCSKNNFVYVLGKMAAYECKDGSWYVGGKKVTTSAVSTAKSSSSQVKQSSSSQVKQSSSSAAKPKSSSSSQKEDDGTKVRGVCQVSASEVEKGQQVKYSFVNMGGTVVTYSWNFGDDASEKTSEDSSPSVSYSRGGTYRAKLVINIGRDSESDEIVCPSVQVNGTPVTGCECSTEESAFVLPRNGEVSATWNVTGCEGGESLTYEWGSGVVAEGTSGTLTVTEEGVMQPTVTITNSDGGSMEPVCKAVPVTGEMSVDCRFDRWNGDEGMINISNIRNAPALEDLNFSLVGSEGDEIPVVAQGYCVSSGCEHWGAVQSITYQSPRYDLMYGEEVLCTYIAVTGCTCGNGTLVSESKDLTEVSPVQYSWTVSNCNSNGAGDLTYSWSGENYEADESDPTVGIGSFTEWGRYYAKVTAKNSLGYSQTVSCGYGAVVEAPYVDKDLEYEDVLSAGSYAAYSYEGGRTWLTWADEGEEIPSDLEDWFEQGLGSVKAVSKVCGGITYQAYQITVSYPVLLTVPEDKSLTLHECIVEEVDDE